ncbi:hypothetical protein Back2_18200 [Nocardioides baekrokdamisoli]|uniref:Uncharacterized protein n=1 Tax=Nocardioides baekrokdamisoli TaxID=1804624 RepID=A0A3G9IYL4_9ACTN|nr:hypothetical protein [Nocardioides baekrokdamisoli]BBH17533.1 hypothetical protein Back2_18200 [Nocardioides baekrokdamisoli]
MSFEAIAAAAASSSVVAAAVSAAISLKVAGGQRDLDRERLQHDRDKHEYERQSRNRDDARALCQNVMDELAFMSAGVQMLSDNWRFWREQPSEDTHEQAKQLYNDVTDITARMPRLLSDLAASSGTAATSADWVELRKHLVNAHQVYGAIVLDALNPGKFTETAKHNWLLVYGRANMAARRLVAEIG